MYWGDRKTCQKGELQLTYITTIGEIDCKNKSMLKLHVSYTKEWSKNMHSMHWYIIHP